MFLIAKINKVVLGGKKKMHWLDVVNIIIAVLLVIAVLLQSSQDDIKDAFSGERSDLFKNKKSRGLERILKIATLNLAILFIILTVISRVITF